MENLEILNSLPVQVWTLAGVFIGSAFTLLGTWYTNKAHDKRFKSQFEYDDKIRQEILIREKLEELYIVSNKYFNTLISHQLPYRMVMEGELTFNQALDLIIEWGEKKDYEPQRLTMLINMYFPELKKQYDEILKIRNSLNDIKNAYKEQYKSGDIDGTKWLELFQPKLELLAEKTTEFEEKLTHLKINISK
ncbi:hypothetical protein [Sulfurimonas microaerophilic]|uniref:hypothetical protein n=1 Tax=Sulfurimonas microaerophilic TaxID=3058392 RepID=UPI0027144FD3|nr:hypothetical protein [Sulfurimonas sp. hsl 1-7]